MFAIKAKANEKVAKEVKKKKKEPFTLKVDVENRFHLIFTF